MKTFKQYFIAIGLMILLTSCVSTSPPPPLTESEIPWRLAAGIYDSTDGNSYEVRTNVHRWSVGEAYLLEATTNPEPEEDTNMVKSVNFVKDHALEGGLGSLLLFLLWKKRKED